jgi:peptidoglycan/LPS O-acetylase OafA/YrhL
LTPLSTHPAALPVPKLKQDTTRLPGLEGLRWVAALCVLLLHTAVIFGLPKVFGKGYLGVDLFFMLSGYVMANSFENRAPGITAPRQSLGKFVLVRWWRMWPMMALGGLIGLPLLYDRTDSWLSFSSIALANLALVPVAYQHETYPLNVPAWTIMFILLGNVLHWLILYRLRRLSLWLAIAASAMMMAAAAAYAGSFDIGARPENMVLALPRLLLGYLIGIALRQGRRIGARLAMPPLTALVAMPVLLASAWWCGINSWLFDMAFVLIACPLMIAGATRLQIGGRLAGFAGAWSFPLYAIHFPLLIRLRNHGFTAWQAVMIALALSALATWLEIQLRKKLKQAGGWRAMFVGRSTIP